MCIRDRHHGDAERDVAAGGDEDVVGLEEDAGADADTHDQADRGEQRVALHRGRIGVDGGVRVGGGVFGGGLGGRGHDFLSQASHADAHVDGLGGEWRGGCESVHALSLIHIWHQVRAAVFVRDAL